MRLITRTGPGEVEFNFMWAPTFIGLDSTVKKEIEKHMGPKLVGKTMDDDTLDWAHDEVIDFLCQRYGGIPGLRDYLDALKFVQDA